MVKKVAVKEDGIHIDTAKIWCPDAESFQYIKVCVAHCKKKDRCSKFRDYFEPKLF